MSTEYYFKKWRKVLAELDALLRIDIEFQETKAHDKNVCEATHRLSTVLSQYMYIYNQVYESLHQNLQVQKTSYISDVLKAVVARILELKHEIRKLEVSEYHFFCNGLIEIKRTTADVELAEIPHKEVRPEDVQALIDEIFEKCREKKKVMEEEENAVPDEKVTSCWWDPDYVEEEEAISEKDEREVLTEEQIETKKNIEIIQAQERSRQIIQHLRQEHNKRQKWEKELSGKLKPPAPLEIREKSAKLIQRVCRAYFELKRQKLLENKRDELLGIKPCRNKEKCDYKERLLQVEENRKPLKRKYEEELKRDQEKMKQDLLKRKKDDIKEDYRDKIRDWFREWYDAINIFHDLPNEMEGGAALILNENLPTPQEWLEEYKSYLIDKKANKTKSAMQLKYEKLEAKRAKFMEKKEEQMKKKLEEQLRRKMMKNPSLHPGYNYPESKKTNQLLEVLENYHKEWTELDVTEAPEVKEKYVLEINKEIAYMRAKLDIIPTIDEDMRKELKLLNAALKRDYENNEEELPEPMKKPRKRDKKKQKVKKTTSENIADKLESLTMQGFITEYPKIKLQDFIGDPNFSGGDLRCNFGLPLPLNGDTRAVWWEWCRALSLGSRRVLVVGPRAGGKTVLLHTLASLNDAVLFTLDARSIRSELMAAGYFEQLVSSIATCARAVQPAVIHIKHVQRLFYKKVPPEDSDIDWEMIKHYFVKKLFKKINKSDKITIVGSCVEPWVSRARPLLRALPAALLLPRADHATVSRVLMDWLHSNPIIPAGFDISSLARVLQGYSFGFIKDSLAKFLSPDRVAKIAVRGLSPTEVYDFILEENPEKVDYDKYLKWYLEKTPGGKKEKKHIEEQIEFKQAMEDYIQKNKKKKAKDSAVTSTSTLKTK